MGRYNTRENINITANVFLKKMNYYSRFGGANMRRIDREITDEKTIEAFIAKEQILRLAFNDNGEIYIVPVNYGYSYKNGKYSFYFHGARVGRKYELSQYTPNVGFEIDGQYKLLESKTACNYSAAYQSVIGTGTIHVVDDKEARISGLNAIMKQTTRKSEWDYNDKMLDAVAVFRLDVDKISCKSH
jgi:hypothetical protein